MKRIYTLLFISCTSTLAAFAHQISADQSLNKVVEMISHKSYATQVRGKADFTLVHTQTSTLNGKALYYVFSNAQRGGFVIAGADHRANSVLGYTENGTFQQALAIPAFRSWLSSCEAAMQWLSDNEATAQESRLPKFNIPDQVVTNADHSLSLTIPGRQYVPDPTLPASVEPLLGGIVWNQNDPYNRLCPVMEADGETVHCATGCVATATAQVMKYYEWPKQGTGSHHYVSNGSVPVELEADFSQSFYDWDNMLDDYSGDFTDQQAYAVAKLMSDVGIAERMDYDAESSSHHYWSTYALATYFGYNKGIQLCDRLYYTHAEWNNLLKTELAQSRPVLYKGTNVAENAGHEFVVDGYDEDGYFHINWGWGGRSNGYFDINYMDPDDQGTGGSNAGYPANQQININCFPDKDGTSVGQYQIFADDEPVLTDEVVLLCKISNMGIAPYIGGKAGFVAMIDNEIIGQALEDVDLMVFLQDYQMQIPLGDLGLTPEMLVDKQCIIYPVYQDGEELKVPLSMVAFQNYVALSIDDDGYLVNETIPEDNASPICESFEITRDYAGYNIKGKAVLTNEEGHPVFDRPAYLIVYDEYGDVKAYGANFAFLSAGQSHELEFNCEPYPDKNLEPGKTYYAELIYFIGDNNFTIPGSETTVTIKDPGPAPELSYSDFALDKTVITPGEDITISFNVANTGGYGVMTYHIALFSDDSDYSINVYSVEADLPTGTTTVSNTQSLRYEPGTYYLNVYTRDASGNWNNIQPEELVFYIQDTTTAITDVTAGTDVICYDLQGRYVAHPSSGLYIQNGKKVAK